MGDALDLVGALYDAGLLWTLTPILLASVAAGAWVWWALGKGALR